MTVELMTEAKKSASTVPTWEWMIKKQRFQALIKDRNLSGGGLTMRSQALATKNLLIRSLVVKASAAALSP
jgi:hypothetical protein